MTTLMPMLIMSIAAAANSDKLKKMIEQVTNVAVQTEVNEITKMIVLDHIGGDPLPVPEEFAEYLRTHMRIQNQTKLQGPARDLGTDRWRTPYRVDYPQEVQVRVTSAGPDKQFDTSDDIYSVRQL